MVLPLASFKPPLLTHYMGGQDGSGVRITFVGQHRTIWKRLLLYVVTLGITRRVWLFRINKEMDGHAALGINHKLQAALLVLPAVGPTIVTYQTTRRINQELDNEAQIPYGPTWPVYLATWVPIFGNLFFIGWTQRFLNAYWADERAHPERTGIDIDQGLSEDPGFVVELQDAMHRSYTAGSRFDKGKDARRERWQRRRQHIHIALAERKAVRAAGGSTPVMPWMRPKRPERRRLKVTCGRCQHIFSVERDPMAETVLLCPKCGLTEVMPSLRGDALAQKEQAVVVALEVDCPECKTHFHAQRDLYGPTDLACPECGHKERLPPPKGAKKATAKAST